MNDECFGQRVHFPEHKIETHVNPMSMSNVSIARTSWLLALMCVCVVSIEMNARLLACLLAQSRKNSA